MFYFLVLSSLFIFLFFYFIHIAKLLIAQGKMKRSCVGYGVLLRQKKNNNKFSLFFSSKKFCVRKNISFAY